MSHVILFTGAVAAKAESKTQQSDCKFYLCAKTEIYSEKWRIMKYGPLFNLSFSHIKFQIKLHIRI